MTRSQWWAIVAGVLAVCACVCALVLSVRATVVCLPAQVDGYARSLLADVHGARTAVESVPALADAQITSAQESLFGEIRGARADLGRSLAALDTQVSRALTIADSRAKEATGSIAGLRADLKPVLASTDELLMQSSGAVAVIRPQALGLIAAAKVTAGETAQTMRTVRDAAPEIAGSAIGVGKSVDGIAADVHTMTSDFVKPKTFWQKFKMWAETAGKVAARFL